MEPRWLWSFAQNNKLCRRCLCLYISSRPVLPGPSASTDQPIGARSTTCPRCTLGRHVAGSPVTPRHFESESALFLRLSIASQTMSDRLPVRSVLASFQTEIGKEAWPRSYCLGVNRARRLGVAEESDDKSRAEAKRVAGLALPRDLSFSAKN